MRPKKPKEIKTKKTLADKNSKVKSKLFDFLLIGFLGPLLAYFAGEYGTAQYHKHETKQLITADTTKLILQLYSTNKKLSEDSIPNGLLEEYSTYLTNLNDTPIVINVSFNPNSFFPIGWTETMFATVLNGKQIEGTEILMQPKEMMKCVFQYQFDIPKTSELQFLESLDKMPEKNQTVLTVVFSEPVHETENIQGELEFGNTLKQQYQDYKKAYRQKIHPEPTPTPEQFIFR